MAPRGGPRRAAVALALALPWMGSGVASLLETDAALSGISVPTFTETGQAQLVALVREVQPETLVVGDYETYGVFETLSPDINVVHVWPAVSVARADAAAATLRYAEGQHLLLVQASAPMVYNLPSARAMQRAAEEEGLALTPAAALKDGSATIYRVDRQPASDGLSAEPAPD